MRLAVGLAIILAAAGSADRAGGTEDDPAALLKKTGFTLSEAIAKAAKQAGDAMAVVAELEEEDGKVIYSIEFAQGTKILEINLDAKSGDIVKKETEDEDKSAVAKACKVALAKAIETALQKVPGLAFVAEAGLEEGRAEI